MSHLLYDPYLAALLIYATESNLKLIFLFPYWIKISSLAAFLEIHQISVSKWLPLLEKRQNTLEVDGSKVANFLAAVTICHEANEHPVTLSCLIRIGFNGPFILPLVLGCVRFVDSTRPHGSCIWHYIRLIKTWQCTFTSIGEVPSSNWNRVLQFMGN